MIGKATYNEANERFVIADRLAKLKGWSGGSAGLVSWVDTDATKDFVRYVERHFNAMPQARIELEPYAGEWVVISENQVAEHGIDLADVVGRARRRGIKPYVIFVERLERGVARLSL